MEHCALKWRINNTFHVGANASQTIAVTIKDFDTTGENAAATASVGIFENIDDTTTTDYEDDDIMTQQH